ncbi:iron-dicitrate transporter ATP-binding subunit [Bowdeniella nasicola]|uniref:Iron-dicitrate transporter ATP-binding subunit n=1 Tax=Bowdeniella nasicola TaxID=208480 RepID=A0A1Q5Q4T2_9ACTO|nr:ABC transporter ATP-binding protein [Bowdeniella nasicola]OKL54837.1 iron-dicitrate transporter ATP-binding subunit [Bowdeniella nasicola]
MTTRAPATLAGHDITAGYGGVPVLSGVSVSIPPGRITALIGPNGCGKSTLLRVLARQLPPSCGVATLDGADCYGLAPRTFAAQVSFLPQQPTAPDGLTVRELISFGRYPYTGVLGTLTPRDIEAVEQAAERTGIADLLERDALALSGGQRQRVWIAMAIAQDSEILLLDEPTSFLDPAHQLAVMRLITQLHRDGKTIAMVLHDMTQAARFADHLIAMSDGEIIATGPVDKQLTPELVRRVFAVGCLMVNDPETGRALPVPFD